jgi:hypothetical protein
MFAVLFCTTALAAPLLSYAQEAAPVTEPVQTAAIPAPDAPLVATTLPDAPSVAFGYDAPTQDSLSSPQQRPVPACKDCEVDANGNPIPLDRQQPKRILGFMPNFRSVSGGAQAHPPGWKYNFQVTTKQAFDWSSFLFLGLTSLSAEGLNEHPTFGKGPSGFWDYSWHGFLDKTDGVYLQGWLLPSLLHEDTRYYAMGKGHPIVVRELYIISRQGVARTYGGHDTPNIAGLGGKVLTQVISRTYYPSNATSFGVLAEKFGYSVMRDVLFTNIREFYPDIAAHYVRKHREKAAAQAARDAATPQPPAQP